MARRIWHIVVAIAGFWGVGMYLAYSVSALVPSNLNSRWWLVEGSGFGSPLNSAVSALEEFNGYVYAGTNHTLQTEIWRSEDGLVWTGLVTNTTTEIHPPYLGSLVLDFAVFENYLYASTLYRAQGGAIWRSPNGIDWTQVVTRNAVYQFFLPFQVYSHTLYVTANTETTAGSQDAEMWRTTDGFSWQVTPLIGLVPRTMAVFDDWLFVGGSDLTTTQAVIWRTDGSLWTEVTDGLTTSTDSAITSLASFQGWLYAAKHDRNSASGYSPLALWRSSNGFEWLPVTSDSLEKINSGSTGLLRSTLVGSRECLYLFTYDLLSGGDVWQSANGIDWDQVGYDGWGDSAARGATASSIAIYQDRLLVGVVRPSPGQLWLFLPHTLSLPEVFKN